MTSLREQWPSLSPRERDARVAESLGREVVWMEPFGAFLVPEDVGGYHWAVPTYSTSWEHAGPLLYQLRSERWSVTLQVNDDPKYGCRISLLLWGEDDQLRQVSTGWAKREPPEAIALAFCLAKEGGR